jgi:hypothetical protein
MPSTEKCPATLSPSLDGRLDVHTIISMMQETVTSEHTFSFHRNRICKLAGYELLGEKQNHKNPASSLIAKHERQKSVFSLYILFFILVSRRNNL